MSSIVQIGIPSHDGQLAGGMLDSCFMAGQTVATFKRGETSFLPWNFNRLWCHALNQRKLGVTHFLLWHSDIEIVTRDWLDVLMSEMDRLSLGVLSVAVPIKDEQGMSSTAFDLCGLTDVHPWPCRRLSMAEIYQLPETFIDSDMADLVGRWGIKSSSERRLLLNTGVMLIDMRQPWASGDFCFKFQNTNVLGNNGDWIAFAEPEDWNISRQFNARGVRLGCTAKVEVLHKGVKRFANDSPWGECATDPAFMK